MAHVYRDMPSAGTILQMEVGYVLTNIPGATDISWDGFSRAVRSPTHLLSPAVVKKPGMPNFGQIKAKVFYDPNDPTHQEVRDALLETAAAASAALVGFKIIWADGFPTPAAAEVIGFISDFSTAATDAETGTVTSDLTIEVNEIVEFTDGDPPE